MPQPKKIPPIVLTLLNRCTNCGFKLIAMPPCPKCGSEIKSFLSPQQYQEILDFLDKNKGSQCRICLGKDGEKTPILMYELLKKTQIGVEN